MAKDLKVIKFDEQTPLDLNEALLSQKIQN